MCLYERLSCVTGSMCVCLNVCHAFSSYRLLKLSKRKDYYKVLGVDKVANADDIKRAYRRAALRHHPDRHAAAEDEVREKEETIFKEVSEAYSVLSDPRKKRKYDSGQDLEDMGMGESTVGHLFIAKGSLLDIASFPGLLQQAIKAGIRLGTRLC